MEEQFVIAIISCAATVFSAYIGWKSYKGKSPSRNEKNTISEYAEKLDGDSESQRQSFAVKNKEYRAIICDILCSHIKRINAFEISTISGKISNSPGIQPQAECLFP